MKYIKQFESFNSFKEFDIEVPELDNMDTDQIISYVKPLVIKKLKEKYSNLIDISENGVTEIGEEDFYYMIDMEFSIELPDSKKITVSIIGENDNNDDYFHFTIKEI